MSSKSKPRTVQCQDCGSFRAVVTKYSVPAYQRIQPLCRICATPKSFAARSATVIAQNKELDEMAVVRLVSGHKPKHTTLAERREATRRLSEHHAVDDIARIIGVDARSVQRYRAQLREIPCK